MKAKMINTTHIEGLIYEHDLQEKETGANSKAPGTKYITGTVSIATNAEATNIVPVHFTYVTAKTAKGNDNATYGALKQIIDGTLGSIMTKGKDGASEIRIDSAIGLNEFYSDRNGQEELVSVKRNEGGFIHTTGPWATDERDCNKFEADMIITRVSVMEADEERGLPEKAKVAGAIFDFRKALLPVEFSAVNAKAIEFFEGLEASSTHPVFIKVRGKQVSETVITKIEEPGAFGEPYIREVPRTNKDWVITWASEPYEWDDESTITVEELKAAQADREVYLADQKKRNDEWKASRNAAPAATSTANDFNF